MWRLTALFLTIAACNQWVRPTPPDPIKRGPEQQREAVVRIEMYCDPFEDGQLGKGKSGVGVMVSDWQVLTAMHVVDCQSSIPTIKVYNYKGQWWNFSPEKEWTFERLHERDGIARIQMSSADTLRPRLQPPAQASDRPNLWDPLYVQTSDGELIGDATGWAYTGTDGRQIMTYVAKTQLGNSGSGVYDMAGALVGIHLGHTDGGKGYAYAALLQEGMVP